MIFLEFMELATLKENFDNCAKKLEKSNLKHSIENSILLNFVNFSTVKFVHNPRFSV